MAANPKTQNAPAPSTNAATAPPIAQYAAMRSGDRFPCFDRGCCKLVITRTEQLTHYPLPCGLKNECTGEHPHAEHHKGPPCRRDERLPLRGVERSAPATHRPEVRRSRGARDPIGLQASIKSCRAEEREDCRAHENPPDYRSSHHPGVSLTDRACAAATWPLGHYPTFRRLSGATGRMLGLGGPQLPVALPAYALQRLGQRRDKLLAGGADSARRHFSKPGALKTNQKPAVSSPTVRKVTHVRRGMNTVAPAPAR